MRISAGACIVVAALAISACGKKTDSPAAGSSQPDGVVAGGTAHLTPAPALPVADNPACKLMTKDEAAKLIGHAVKDPESRSGGAIPGCRFKSDGAIGSVSIQYFERGAQNYDELKSMMIKDSVDIAGVGTKACRNADGSLIEVLQNGHMAMVAVIVPGKNNGPTPAAAEDFARTVAGRM